MIESHDQGPMFRASQHTIQTNLLAAIAHSALTFPLDLGWTQIISQVSDCHLLVLICSSPMAMKTESPHLTRAFGLLHATALNISNMVGIGPFITIPLLMASMGGPQSLLGWLTGALIVTSDGLIWSELGAALPGSGGSYHFLREAYGHHSWGRLMAFLFIWQFVLSGPLEIASGM